MRILLAPDSYKGSLSSEQLIDILALQAERHFPGCTVVSVPIADGGEGTLNTVLNILHGEKVCVSVSDPLFQPVKAYYGRLDEKTAFIEMAQASGLSLIPFQTGNAGRTSTYGTGEMICHALEHGCTTIYLAVGGSATNDGGIGALAALGVEFFDEGGNLISPVGDNLIYIDRICTEHIHPSAKNAVFHVLCDVDNPLIGTRGASTIYGPQKGASASDVARLEQGMAHYASKLYKTLGRNVSATPGAGAAGGLSAAMMAFFNADLISGIEAVFKIINFDRLLDGVDLIITGEGRVDAQSAQGKVLCGIGKHAAERNIPVIAFVAGMGEGAPAIYDCGIDSIFTTVNGIMPLEDAMERASDLCNDAADRLFRLLKIGKRL